MQFENDDMEELFREAAENYPLKITGADWSKVREGMKHHDTAALKAPRNLKNMLWLLLLLFIPLLCTVFNKSDRNAASDTILAATGKTSGAPEKIATDQISDGNIAHDVPQNDQTKAVSPTIAANTTDPAGQLTPNGRGLNRRHTNARYRLNISGDVGSHNDITANNDPATLKEELNTEIRSPELTVDNNTIVAGTQVITGKKITEKETEPLKKTEIKDSNAVVKKQQGKKQKAPKLYLSLLAAPDLSRVKDAAVKRVGISAGISAGYNINKHFAIEAAALYSKKHYESDYKYFNNSKTNWPSGAQISELRGTCQMIELPLTLRYNFNINNKNKFFAAAGLSSYIMKKESYEYTYSYNSGYGTTTQRQAYKAYTNSSQNWLSVLQLSAGWQRNLGKKLALRVQPYYNIPLQGVGIGSLPISGAGVLAGFTVPIK